MDRPFCSQHHVSLLSICCATVSMKYDDDDERDDMEIGLEKSTFIYLLTKLTLKLTLL